MFDPKLIAAEWYLGGLDSESLPELALDALQRGLEGKNLACLAALVKPTKRDVEGLIDGALRELGVEAPLSMGNAALLVLELVKADASSDEITARSLVGKLLYAFPEWEKRYVEEVESYYGVPGNYWVAAVILRPAIKEQAAKGNGGDFLPRLASFLERVCNSKDREPLNVLWIEVFEHLVHGKPDELQFIWRFLGPSTKAIIEEVAFRRGETKNLPKGH